MEIEKDLSDIEKIIIGKGQILWKNIIFQNKIIPYEYKPVYYLFFIIQFTIIKHKSDKFLLHYRNSSIKFKRKVMRINVILAHSVRRISCQHKSIHKCTYFDLANEIKCCKQISNYFVLNSV